MQLDVFDEQRETDENQISGPDGVDLSSHIDVFYAILRQVRIMTSFYLTFIMHFDFKIVLMTTMTLT